MTWRLQKAEYERLKVDGNEKQSKNLFEGKSPLVSSHLSAKNPQDGVLWHRVKNLFAFKTRVY